MSSSFVLSVATLDDAVEIMRLELFDDFCFNLLSNFLLIMIH